MHKARNLRIARVVGAAVLIGGLLAPSRTVAGAPTTPEVVVRANAVVRPINRNLVGFHGRDSAASIPSTYGEFAPTSIRHVMSDYDFLDFDCATKTISPASIDYFGSWIDAVTAQGARPILSLSYVPPCFARDGQPKGPPNPDDVDEYRTFLHDLLAGLVTDRVQAGKEPMRWLELWNEPDIPIDPGSPYSGHGYVGTIDEYVQLNLPSLVGAILDTEAASGVDLHIGTPASFAPWSFGSVYGDLATMLERANGYDRATAEALAAQADLVLGPGGGAAVLANGGFQWTRRITDEAAALGLHLDFASVHLYPNNPLQGVKFPEVPEPVFLFGRNPDASPEEYGELARRWSAEFPDQELIVSEWALSAGSDDRFGTCETAAFDAASLSVMQTSEIDRALYLSRPRGVEGAPFRAWGALPASQVAVDEPAIDGVWSTAASDGERTTLLLSQWHTRLTDAADVAVPVAVEGLEPGTYTVTVERIGQGSSPAAAMDQWTVTAKDGRIALPEPVALRGQSLARVDVRATGVPALAALTRADPSGPAQTCLTEASEPTTTTAAPSSSTSSTPGSTTTTTTTASTVPATTTPRETTSTTTSVPADTVTSTSGPVDTTGPSGGGGPAVPLQPVPAIPMYGGPTYTG